MENLVLWRYGYPVQLLDRVDNDSKLYRYDFYVAIDKNGVRSYENMEDLVEQEKGMYLTLVPYARDNNYCYLELEKDNGSKVVVKLLDYYTDSKWDNHDYYVNMYLSDFSIEDYDIDFKLIYDTLRKDYYTDRELKQEYNNIYHNTKGYRDFVDYVVRDFVDSSSCGELNIFLDKPYIDCSYYKINDSYVDCDLLWTMFEEELKYLKENR